MDGPPALAATLDRSPIPSWVCIRETLAIVAANDAAIARLGWPRGRLLASTMRELWVDAASEEAKLADASSTALVVTWRQRTENGDVVDVEAAVCAHEHAGRAAWLVQATRVESAALARTTRRNVERFAALFEQVTEGVAIIDEFASLAYVSPTVARMLGYTPEELVGVIGGGLVHEEDRARLRPRYEELLRTPGGTQTFLARYKRKDGAERWIESTVGNLLHDPGVRGLVTHFRDVTDAVAARTEVDAARRRLEYLLSATSAITYSCEVVPPYAATFVSDNLTAVLGYTPREFLSDPAFWVDRIHPDDKEAILAQTPTFLEAGRKVHEYRFRHADGSWRWIHDDLVAVRDESGRPVEIIGCFFDVTARREAQAALQRSEANFRTLIENAAIAVLVHRAERIVYANPAMVRLLGYERLDELVGVPSFSIVAPAHRDEARRRSRSLEEAPGNAKTPLASGEMITRSGGTVAVEVESFKLDFDGAPAAVVFARDVSERQAMLAQLAASDRLASVGMLAAGVAHEINNPLSFIHTNLALIAAELPELLRGGGSARLRGPELELMLRDALDGAARIQSIVRDLRTLSYPDRGSVVRLDVREVVDTCLRMAENQIRPRARLVTKPSAEPLFVEGNASRLSQLFLNLLINAAQAIPEGAPADNAITVTVCGRDAEGQAAVEVTDTGAGIPASIRGRIFDPFFTTKAVGVGVGLGLAICHGIVTAHGGSISVESEVGRGTTFRVVLPLTDRAPTRAPTRLETTSQVERMRILVIDDERAIGQSLQMLLGDEHDVVAVTRAREGLDRIASGQPFDVVFCDLTMPEMDGMSFYRHLGEVMPPLSRRVVFLTGGAFTSEAREFLGRTRNLRLEKPFEIKEMYETLRAVREL